MELVSWATDLAERLLAAPLPRRWAHTQGVGRKAQAVAHLAGQDADVLVATAWLHDIGYAPSLAISGFHPLDGARYLRDVEKAPADICRLVANHSYAIIEAKYRGLATELDNEFPKKLDLLEDLLVFCDMTTSPDGLPVSIEDRLSEILTRYGPADAVTRFIEAARASILASVARISRRT